MAVKDAARSGGLGEMRSPVNWALLGLVIERPSYGYELTQRFEHVYGDVLHLSSPSHIYAALNALQTRSLIEVVPDSGSLRTPAGRQPKPHYRVTLHGSRSYRERLVAQQLEGVRRSQLFIRQLAVLVHEPDAALHVLDRYEQACLGEVGDIPLGTEAAGGAGSHDPALVGRLTAEEQRLTVGARLSWVEYARREFGALAGDGSRRR